MRQVWLRRGVALGLVVWFCLLLAHALYYQLDEDYWRWRAERVRDDDPALALVYYRRAISAGADSSALTSDMLSLRHLLDPAPARQPIYVLAKARQSGWTDDLRLRYLESQGAISALQFLIASGQALSPAELENIWVLVAADLEQLDWASLRGHLQALLSSQPENPRANYLLGVLLAIEDPPLAGGYLDNAASDPLYSASVGRIQALIALYTPDTAHAYYQSLGNIFIELGEWGVADYAFTRAVAIDSLDWFSFAWRGYARDQLGINALKDHETAVALAPAIALPYYFLGLHWRGQDPPDFAKAHAALSRAWLLEPENPALAVEIGQTYQQENELTTAAEWYALAVSLDPTNLQWRRVEAMFYADTAYALEQTGLDVIEQVYEIAPDDVDIVASLGRAYHLRNRGEEASYHLRRAVALSATNARARYYYALLLEAQGDLPGARFSLQEVISLEGDSSGYGLLAARRLATLP
jgi:Flp pilus assembly protein TadD